MQHEATLPATLPPLYDAMRHVARLMADAAEAADWETLDAARDCARVRLVGLRGCAGWRRRLKPSVAAPRVRWWK